MLSDPEEIQISDLANDRLFIRWVRTGDPEADAFWRAWCLNHPEMEQKVDAARSIVLSLQFDDEPIPMEEIHDEWNRVRMTFSSELKQKKQERKWMGRKRLLSIAAVLLLPAMLIPAVYLIIGRSAYQSSDEVSFISKTTSPGQKLTITLSDGTTIMLNSDSEIEYPTRFNGDRREVTLKGEAFFDVTHNERVPFTVRSEGVVVVVLGTAFNVSAYPESTNVKVALEKGKVKVETPEHDEQDPDVVLSPNEMIEINKTDYSARIQPFDALEVTGWKDGCLYLGKADFNETVVKLERWFGVEFEIDAKFQSSPDWRFIGKFKDRSLAYILETISYPNLFKYKIEAQKVLIY